MSHSMDGLDSASGPGVYPDTNSGNNNSRNVLFVLFTAAFVGGNLFLQTHSKLISFNYVLLIICGLITCSLVYKKTEVLRQQYFTYSLAFIIIFTGFFASYFRAWLQADNYLKHSLAADVMSQDVQIPACINSLPKTQSGFSRFIVEPITDSQSMHSHLKRIRVSANLKQFANTESEIEFKAGDCWHWNLRLKTTRGLRNTHTFDYEKWLYLQDVGATGYLRALPQKITKTKYPWLTFRANLASKIKQILPANSPITALILGLSLGIRDDISTQQWTVLQNTGTSHLLAISGLHIGIAALFGFYLGKILFIFLVKIKILNNSRHVFPLHLAIALSMVFAVFYSAMAGFSVSTQRACVMLLALSLCSFGSIRFKPSSILCIALITVLLFDPRALLSAGTWFSFIAVGILLTLIKREKQLVKKDLSLFKIRINKLKHAANLQLFLVLFLSVPVALVFSKVSIISPLVNFFLIPIFSLTVVPVLLVALIFINVIPEFTFALINLQHSWLEFLWKYIELFANLPIAHSELQMGAEFAALYCILLVALILPKGVLPRKYSFIMLMPFMFAFSAKTIKPHELDITVFDVGQGLSVFLQTANHQLLYDTGPGFRSGSSSAERVIKPWLQSENIKTISTLLISHSDNDHAGGAELINDTFKPEFVIAPKADSIDYTNACEAGYSWDWDGVHFEFLYPFENTRSKNTNNNSCVLRVSLHGKSILLTGDIEKEAERALLSVYKKLRSDIVFVPHHGSRTSSTVEFVNAVNPQIAIIPAGFANRWRFPKPDILQRWQKSGADVYNIATTGQLNLKINSQGEISQSTWIATQCRYWHQDCQNGE